MSLTIKNLHARYDSSQVLFGIDMDIPPGKIVTLLGRNGMGKSTTVKSIMGMIPNRTGHIEFNGKPIGKMQPHDIARQGIGLVPEGRRIFPTLTVRENLIAMMSNRGGMDDPWTVDKVVDMFPNLGKRMANDGWQLSGGEQQMLAIGRALMTNPKLLILDEATEGLAPLIREEIWSCLAKLKSMELSILLIDKNIEKIMRIADRHFILEKGHVVWEGDSSRLQADLPAAQRYLGI